MKKPPKELAQWQIEDASRLKDLFQNRAKESQAEFGAKYEIGTQGMVWQYLNAHRPLNLKAAHGFARGLGIQISSFSPTLAAEFDHAIVMVLAQAGGPIRPDQVMTLNFDALMEQRNEIVHHTKEVNPTDIGRQRGVKNSRDGRSPDKDEIHKVSGSFDYPVDIRSARRVFVVEHAQGAMPERLWTDGEKLVGATDKFAEIATSDPQAFLVPVVGHAMTPRYNAGEFALVEPEIEPELEDDVLVRLTSGETMLKRLLARRGGIRLGSYNDPDVQTFDSEQISWMYYVAHPVPARKIRQR